MKTSKRRDIMFIATIVAVIGFGGLAFYLEKKHDARIAAIMTGEIRGNKESRIFHVPTCSQYDSIKPSHLRTFATVEEAEEANYRPSRNCLDAAITRNINETEINEGPDGGHDDPRY